MTRVTRRRLGLSAVIMMVAAACGGTGQLPALEDGDESAADGGASADATSSSNGDSSSGAVVKDGALEDVTSSDEASDAPTSDDGGPGGDDASDALSSDDSSDGDANDASDGGAADDASDGGAVDDASDGGAADDASDGGAVDDASDAGIVPPPDDAGADTSDASSSTQEAVLAGGSITAYGFGPGNHVSISGDTIAIGSPGVSSRAGEVEMYRWSLPADGGAGSWNLEKDLIASDSSALANFGTSVNLDPGNADHLIVGDIWGPTSNMGPTTSTGPGEAFIFTRSGTTWTQTAKLACPSATTVSQFGYAVALAGKTAVVGWPRIYPAPGYTMTGMAVIFTQGPMGKWTKSLNLTLTGYASYEYAGTSLSLVGSTLLVGAPGDWTRANGMSAGRVEVFTGSGSSWTSLGSLTASDGVKWDQFGWSVAQSSTTNTIVVGAPSHAVSDGGSGTVSQAGAAYVFAKSGNAWSQQAELLPPTPTASAKFGYTVAAAGDDRVIVGSPGTKELFLYTRAGTTWTLAATYTACNNGAIGASLAASGDLAVSAASNAWVFDLADPDTSCVGP